jgi:hypothetical protein
MPLPKPSVDPPPNADNPEQSRRFIDMAREVEADETPGAMDRTFERVIKPRSDGSRQDKAQSSSSG